MLQTSNDVLTGDLGLIAATLLEQLTPPVSPQQVELLAQAITGEVCVLTHLNQLWTTSSRNLKISNLPAYRQENRILLMAFTPLAC